MFHTDPVKDLAEAINSRTNDPERLALYAAGLRTALAHLIPEAGWVSPTMMDLLRDIRRFEEHGLRFLDQALPAPLNGD